MTRKHSARSIASLLITATLLCASAAGAREAARPYVKLEHCRLLPNPSNDGDSFHVSASGKEYIFRLYFTDTPETEMEFPERVKAQAVYFGITPEEAIRIGKIAADFTRNKLAPKAFTVYTRWQDARGESRLPRYYAFVMVEDKTLEELLVANGLARVYGMPANLPDGTRASAFEAHLKALEAKAKQDHLGGWSIRAPKNAATPAAGKLDQSSWEKMFPRASATP